MNCKHADTASYDAPCQGCFGSGGTPNWEPVKMQDSPGLNLNRPIVPIIDAANPKDMEAARRSKAPLSCVPTAVLTYAAMQMHNGAQKYGKHNFRASGVSFSVYYEAVMRHMIALWNGEEFDEEGVPNLAGLAANVAILCDATAHGYLKDDRPPSVNERALFDAASKIVAANNERNKDKPVPVSYHIGTPTFKASQ